MCNVNLCPADTTLVYEFRVCLHVVSAYPVTENLHPTDADIALSIAVYL